MNEPVAIRYDFDGYGYQYMDSGSGSDWQTRVEGELLYVHPVKELHLSLQKSKQTGELLAVTYTDDEHRIVEVLWQRPPVKEPSVKEMTDLWLYVVNNKPTNDKRPIEWHFANAILRKGTREMNANQLIEFQEDKASEARANGFSDVRFMQTATMLRQQQAEIEKLRNWVEMLVEVPFFDEIDHYRGIPVSILRKAEEE